MNETRRGFIDLHLGVLLAGFTGLFGRLITLNEVDIVWYRMLFTSICLLFITGLPRIGWKKILRICGCGALLGGVDCFSLIGFFTALFEPMILKRRYSWVELGLSFITFAGVICIFSFDVSHRTGIAIGVASSAVYALYAICNKKVSTGINTWTMMMYQMSGGLVAVSLIAPLYLLAFPSDQPVVVFPDTRNLILMLCHALIFTIFMCVLQIQALRRLSAFTVNLTYNLEPCYTIILAFIIFGEGKDINFSFYLGISLILLSVLLQSIRAWKK